jgi:hypothetical protein
LVAHRRDEITYTIHLFAFKKAFPDFIYCNPNSSKLSNPMQDVEEDECNETIKET